MKNSLKTINLIQSFRKLVPLYNKDHDQNGETLQRFSFDVFVIRMKLRNLIEMYNIEMVL